MVENREKVYETSDQTRILIVHSLWVWSCLRSQSIPTSQTSLYTRTTHQPEPVLNTHTDPCNLLFPRFSLTSLPPYPRHSSLSADCHTASTISFRSLPNLSLFPLLNPLESINFRSTSNLLLIDRSPVSRLFAHESSHLFALCWGRERARWEGHVSRVRHARSQRQAEI